MELSEHQINRMALLFERIIGLFDRKRVDCSNELRWTAELEEQFEHIKSEYRQYPFEFEKLNSFQDISPAQKSITDDQQWKVVVMYAFGQPIQRNLTHFPETTKILKRIPGMTSAMISILGPNKHIPPHRGPYKGVLRLLLPIQMPSDRTNCYIIVDGQRYEWEEGRSFVFDDALYHEVHNATSEIRVALFVDFYRPLLFPLNVINKFVYSRLMRTRKVQETLELLAKETTVL